MQVIQRYSSIYADFLVQISRDRLSGSPYPESIKSYKKYLGENMKYDPMMDDSSDDGLPDLEELPALDKASTADFEVRPIILFHARSSNSIFTF